VEQWKIRCQDSTIPSFRHSILQQAEIGRQNREIQQLKQQQAR
jgi:hypothetical protein